MRVKIEHVETRVGFVLTKTVHEVHLTVDFTHEEKQIIRQRGLTDQVIVERLPVDARPDDDPEWYHLKIGHLFDRKPDRFRCKAPVHAKIYEANVTEALQTLKLWLDANAEAGSTTVFEL